MLASLFQEDETSSRARALTVWLLAAALLAGYLWVPNEKGSNDNYAHCLTALSLARGEWGRLDDLREYWSSPELGLRATVIETPDGHVVGGTGIGAALALAPFYVLANLAGAGSILMLSPAFNHPIAALWSVVGVVAFYLTCRRLVARRPAAFATLTVALGSSVLSVLSREPWQHTFLVALQCVALWLVLKPDATGPRGALAAGLLLGWGGLVRATGFLYVVAWAWLVRRAGRDRLRPFLIGVLPGLLATLAYNWWTFGRPWLFGQLIIGRVRFGYEASHAVPFNPLTALAGLLVSPGRGLFVFSPVLLWALLVLAAVAVGRRGADAGDGRVGSAPWPFWLAPALAIIAVNLASAATWKEWAGGWTYGPRYLSDTIPSWGLVVAAAAARAGLGRGVVHRGLAILAWPLLAVSIAFHAAGLLVSPYRPDAYSARIDPDHHPERLWRWRDFPPLDNLRLWIEDRAEGGRTKTP
ncbi:MAG: glycosyltransferase family 39 protein [Thermoanaerobaculaceae bacterium]|nr:glycosyltransferase family 39 protein [Thermoanaerobaculaceae bacterium]MDI9620418.1 glycosyltransferase family 39 protein [Acidobacteriota bacterium]NLH12357.1 hypothetical protein [Holophagae bacterium]HPW55094.1 glycosyltransferase family 39 protein [Thermoanaerobaculaceae bacterium]